MSTEVNSYEEWHICNANVKTAVVFGLVGEYLIANWGILLVKVLRLQRRFSLLCAPAARLVLAGGWMRPS